MSGYDKRYRIRGSLRGLAGQFFNDLSLRGSRENFNTWIANLAADLNLSVPVDPNSAEHTLQNFFSAFDLKLESLKKSPVPAPQPVTLPAPVEIPEPVLSVSPVADIPADEFTAPVTARANVSPSVNRDPVYASRSLAPDSDTYSTALIPGVPLAEKQDEKTASNVAWLTAAALFFML